MTLLHEEHPRTGFKLLLHELELPLRQTESRYVFLCIGVDVRKENLGRCLLDNGATDWTLKHITRALGCEAHDAIQLAPGLRAFLCETLECRIGKKAPEFIHPANKSAAIKQLTHDM